MQCMNTEGGTLVKRSNRKLLCYRAEEKCKPRPCSILRKDSYVDIGANVSNEGKAVGFSRVAQTYQEAGNLEVLVGPPEG